MRILLVNPSGGYRHEYPPLGILYIASALKEDGHNVIFFDGGVQKDTKKTLLECALQFNPQACGVALYTTNLFTTFEAISMLKSNLPQCKIFVGGPHATALPQRTLTECDDIDFLVCGEGEITSRELMSTVELGGDVSKINGLYYRDNERILNTHPRELVADLDTIAFPSYELIKNFRYLFDPIRVGRKIATVMTSRGCPYDCNFCAAKAVWGRGFRRRSPQNVIAEIKQLISKYDYDEIYFMDDLFGINNKWLDEFYVLMRQHSINVPWKCLSRVDILSYKDYKKMADNGCYLVQFGVESGDNRILEDINKHITTIQIKKAFNEAHLAGLNTYGFFILGHNRDTPETVMKTINFSKSICPDFVSFFCLVPFPGTHVYNFVPEHMRFDWSKIAYSAWDRELVQMQLSNVDSKDLLFLEKQSYINIYCSFWYVLKNIILSRANTKLLQIKVKFVIAHFLLFIKAILSKKWILGRYKKIELSEHLDQNSFKFIWNEYLRREDFKEEIKHHIEERKNFLAILKKYISLSKAKNVIEIGCGTAIDSHYLSGIFEEVNFWAIDISADAVSVANKIGKLLDSKIKVSVDNTESMKFQDNFFDIVFSQGTIEHFKDPLPVFKEQIRVLNSQGYLIVNVPQKFNPYTIYKHRRIKEGIWEYGWEKEYSFKELIDIGKKCGLNVVDAVGDGYGYFQDYGLGLLPLFLKWVRKSKNQLVAHLGSFFLNVLSLIEKKYGHFFLQNITVVYQKI